MYLFGGYKMDPLTSDVTVSDSVFAYNHITNLWQSLCDRRLPKQLVDMAIVCVQRRGK